MVKVLIIEEGKPVQEFEGVSASVLVMKDSEDSAVRELGHCVTGEFSVVDLICYRNAHSKQAVQEFEKMIQEEKKEIISSLLEGKETFEKTRSEINRLISSQNLSDFLSFFMGGK